MTINNKDDRRNHRIATYLSAPENNKFQQKLVQSNYSKASEFHRSLILESLLESKSKIEVPPVNTEVALKWHS